MSKSSKKAIIYCRQSSGKEEDSESIAAQEAACRKFAKARGIEVIGVFSDANTPGRLYPTGAEELCSHDAALQEWLRHHTTEKRFRAGLGSALAALPGVSFLLVYDLTRLYRPVQNSYLQDFINQKLASCGTDLVSLKEGKIDFRNFTDSLVSTIKSQVNDNQIAMTREKAKQAMARLQDDGYYCTQPKMYGIRYLGGKERQVEVIPEQAEVIRFVYDSVLRRMKYTDLLRELNRRFAGRHPGKCFYDSSWRHIVANPFYCGFMYNSDGALIRAKQMEGKEIIPYETWQKANEIVNSPRSAPRERKNKVHPFSGLMYCGHCGSRMSVTEDYGKVCYSCLQGVNVRHDAECGGSRTNINLVRATEEFTGLRKAIAPLLLLALYKELEMRHGQPKIRRLLEEANVRLLNLAKRQDELASAYADGKCAYPAYEAAFMRVAERKAAVTDEITKLTRELEMSGNQEKKAAEYLALVDKVMADRLEDCQFKDLLLRSVNKIVCHLDRLEIETVYGPFTLRRYMKGNYRNFPKFKYSVRSASKTRKVTNLDDCRINVTYLYGDREKQELVVDLKVMRIYQK